MTLLIMEEYKTSHLIVLSELEFKGILNQESILEMDDLTKGVNSILSKWFSAFIGSMTVGFLY